MNGCLATDCMHDGMHTVVYNMHTHTRTQPYSTYIDWKMPYSLHACICVEQHVCCSYLHSSRTCVQLSKWMCARQNKSKGWWNEKAIAKSVCACVCVCVATAQPLSCLSYSNIYEKRGKRLYEQLSPFELFFWNAHINHREIFLLV